MYLLNINFNKFCKYVIKSSIPSCKLLSDTYKLNDRFSDFYIQKKVIRTVDVVLEHLKSNHCTVL